VSVANHNLIPVVKELAANGKEVFMNDFQNLMRNCLNSPKKIY